MSKVVQKKLCEISNIVMGQSPSSNFVFDDLGHGLPFLQGCAEFGRKFPNPFKSCSNGPKRAIKGSTLISVRAPVGDTNLADRDYIIGRGLASIEANGVDADYLSFAINFSKDNLQRVSQGSTFAAVGSKEINDLQIPFFERHEQAKIAQILSSIDEQIELTEKLIEKKKVIKEGLFNSLLSSLSLESIELGKFCRIEIGGTPSRSNYEYWSATNSGFPWVSIADLKSKIIKLTKESITEKAVASSNVKLLPANTLMMSFKLTLGKVAIAGVDLYTNEAIAAMYPDDSCRSMWLYYLLPYVVQNSISETAVKGATLNKQSMAKLLVPIPEIKSQDKFIGLMTLCDSDIETETLLLEKLISQKQGLMQDLLTGQVRVS